jgi:16S rRNA processing protein RimM
VSGQADGLVCLGAVAGAHGVRGEVKVKTFTEEPEGLAAYGPLTAVPGGRTYRVRSVRPAKGGAVVRLEGVTDREAAEALKGTQLCVSREALGETEEEDIFFHADLIGLVADDEAGRRIGTVTAVHDFGAGDMLEVLLDETGKSVFVSFRRETVPEVDVKGGRLVVRPDEEGEEA